MVARLLGGRVAVGLVSALIVTAASRFSRGQQDATACKGTFSIFSPLPDACLGFIDTDRPHQTDTPHVVPAGHAQIESAIGEVQLGGTVSGVSNRHAHVVLFDDNYKVGLVSDVDAQLLFAHVVFDPVSGKLEPPGPLELRLKFNAVKESGWIPALTLVPWIFLPVAPHETPRGGPLVFLGWELSEHFELEVNAGVLFGAAPQPPASVVLASAVTYVVTDHFGVFADIYLTTPDLQLGTGALWAFTRDMQIDLGTYVGLRGDEYQATPFLGFSMRR